MTIKGSGSLAMTEIQAEFGGSAPIALSEYYGRGQPPVSASGRLAMSEFYGKSLLIPGNSGVLTASSGYYDVPVTAGSTVNMLLIGGGGGGGGGSGRTFASGYYIGGGGGAAGTCVIRYGVDMNQFTNRRVYYYIGAGGAAGGVRDGIFTTGGTGGAGNNSQVNNDSSVILRAPGAGIDGQVAANSPNGTGQQAYTASDYGPYLLNAYNGDKSIGTSGGPGAPGYDISTALNFINSVAEYGAFGLTYGENTGSYSTNGTGWGAGGSGGGCAQSDVYNYANMFSTAGTRGALFIWWGYRNTNSPQSGPSYPSGSYTPPPASTGGGGGYPSIYY
jgi:hypothetical protein